MCAVIGDLPIHLATRQLHHWDQPHRALPQSTGAAPGLKRTAPPGLLFFLRRKHPNITFSSLLFFTAAFLSFLFPSSISSLLDFSLFFSLVHFFSVFLNLAYLSPPNLPPTLSPSHSPTFRLIPLAVGSRSCLSTLTPDPHFACFSAKPISISICRHPRWNDCPPKRVVNLAILFSHSFQR